MKIHNLENGRKIINYQPRINQQYKSCETVYEFGDKRLQVNTILENNKKLVQTKSLSQNGQELKEIVIKFVDGIRKNILRLR